MASLEKKKESERRALILQEWVCPLCVDTSVWLCCVYTQYVCVCVWHQVHLVLVRRALATGNLFLIWLAGNIAHKIN